VHHHLLAVADAEDRHAEIEDRAGGRGAPSSVTRPARPRGSPPSARNRAGRRRRPVERVDLAIDVQLAQAARDQLRHLAAEVDDQKAVVLVMAAG
jgi:hypothetical protein